MITSTKNVLKNIFAKHTSHEIAEKTFPSDPYQIEEASRLIYEPPRDGFYDLERNYKYREGYSQHFKYTFSFVNGEIGKVHIEHTDVDNGLATKSSQDYLRVGDRWVNEKEIREKLRNLDEMPALFSAPRKYEFVTTRVKNLGEKLSEVSEKDVKAFVVAIASEPSALEREGARESLAPSEVRAKATEMVLASDYSKTNVLALAGLIGLAKVGTEPPDYYKAQAQLSSQLMDNVLRASEKLSQSKEKENSKEDNSPTSDKESDKTPETNQNTNEKGAVFQEEKTAPHAANRLPIEDNKGTQSLNQDASEIENEKKSKEKLNSDLDLSVN